MSEPLLRLEGVHTHIDQYHILQGVDFMVPQGQVTALLGRNGAGKTTTLRTVMGLWSRSRGKIVFEGDDIGGLRTADIARRGIAYVPETMAVFAGLTVRENMLLATHQATIDKDRLDRVVSLFPALKKFWNLEAGALSGGQKQMLAIARSMIEPHKLLVVDEPTKGLAPAIINALIEAFQELKYTDTTILLVEQNFHFARSVADRVAVMDGGKISHTGGMDELAGDEALQQRLLGLSLDANQQPGDHRA